MFYLHSVYYKNKLYKIQRETQKLGGPGIGIRTPGKIFLERPGASERSRENACYKRKFFIQTTCSMNAKGQTWNENIWTVTRPKEKSPS